jgi:acetyltransferase-like isoleucine patch superfamily enzyme
MHATRSAAAPALTDRSYRERVTGGPNAHKYWFRARDHLDGPILGPVRIVVNYLVIYLGMHLPSLSLKRRIFRCLGMRLGRDVTIASGVVLDYFFPELIEIGDNTIIGMDAMLLTHEFLHDRLRYGRVRIGANCLVGARSTVLAGVTIADGSIIAAMSLLHKGTPAGMFAGGVPIRPLRRGAAGGDAAGPPPDRSTERPGTDGLLPGVHRGP